jgi:hypothetical protein
MLAQPSYTQKPENPKGQPSRLLFSDLLRERTKAVLACVKQFGSDRVIGGLYEELLTEFHRMHVDEECHRVGTAMNAIDDRNGNWLKRFDRGGTTGPASTMTAATASGRTRSPATLAAVPKAAGLALCAPTLSQEKDSRGFAEP